MTGWNRAPLPGTMQTSTGLRAGREVRLLYIKATVTRAICWSQEPFLTNTIVGGRRRLCHSLSSKENELGSLRAFVRGFTDST